MDTVRTADQKKADELLEEAISACLKAYGYLEGGDILGDFAIICATNQLDESGVVTTHYPILLPQGDIPFYRILGLMEVHQTIAKQIMKSGSTNG